MRPGRPRSPSPPGAPPRCATVRSGGAGLLAAAGAERVRARGPRAFPAGDGRCPAPSRPRSAAAAPRAPRAMPPARPGGQGRRRAAPRRGSRARSRVRAPARGRRCWRRRSRDCRPGPPPRRPSHGPARRPRRSSRCPPRSRGGAARVGAPPSRAGRRAPPRSRGSPSRSRSRGRCSPDRLLEDGTRLARRALPREQLHAPAAGRHEALAQLRLALQPQEGVCERVGVVREGPRGRRRRASRGTRECRRPPPALRPRAPRAA